MNTVTPSVGVVIVTHGQLATELLNAAETIVGDLPRFAAVSIDRGVLAFVTGLSVLCGLVFGVAPAFHATRIDLSDAIKVSGRRSAAAGASGSPLRSSFIAAEVALAVVLAVGAGLLIRTLWGLTRVDPGFRSQQNLTLAVSPNAASNSSGYVGFWHSA